MALPFLKDKKSIADVIVAGRRPDSQPEEAAEPSESEELIQVAGELASAIHANDSSAVAAALRAAVSLIGLDK